MWACYILYNPLILTKMIFETENFMAILQFDKHNSFPDEKLFVIVYFYTEIIAAFLMKETKKDINFTLYSNEICSA